MARSNETVGQNDGGSTVEHLKDKASQVGQTIRDMGGQLRDAAKEEYGNIRDQAGEYYDRSKAKAHEWEEGIEHYVQEKPIKALLIAAGVGLVLGMLWKRH